MNPTIKDPMISISGITRSDNTLTLAPLTNIFAIDTEIENTTRPTASSPATTGKSVSTSGPSALYWWITIKVAAGAVAVAIAPKQIAIPILSPKNLHARINPISTRIQARIA